ncbi:MAG TPA: recombinase family protein [Acholeplasmatales bacterium]|jgi:serine recombinase, site-specific|nr:recombinase family protein [Bacilli bacterium]MBS6562852.1 recombinase family protein [Staphylococcus sp.]CDC68576.1 serine recombinase site-specific [Staphylococcus sp. CAG:324]HAR58097.1 recombinase family protein [Acholeplasmatales bacterium]
MKYGYVRVSTTTQNIDRQMEEMHKFGLTDEFIYIDKQSGKDFDRPNYQIMKSKLKKDDLLIIKSIDRLGRNYEMIIKEWSDITKIIEADICVIDFPLLDTRSENTNLVGKFISDIVLQVLSFVAQNERENIRQRQAEGIRIAKEKGVHMGRPKYKLPNNFTEIVVRYHNKELTHIEAAEILNMTRGTFLKYSKLIKKEQD